MVFADTSALIKLYLNETDSTAVIEHAAGNAVTVCRTLNAGQAGI